MAKILVVDDEALVRQMIADIVAAAGHDVSTAVDGVDALSVFDRDQPDLVITDLVMPNMGGLKLIGELQRSRPATRIIAISGGDRAIGLNFLSAARTYGVATLGKPFRPRELLDAVDAALASGS